MYDKQRHLLHQMYAKEPLILWNGNPVQLDFYSQLPPTEHDIQSFDGQIHLGQMMVMVSGQVNSKLFSQTFVLTQHQGTCMFY